MQNSTKMKMELANMLTHNFAIPEQGPCSMTTSIGAGCMADCWHSFPFSRRQHDLYLAIPSNQATHCTWLGFELRTSQFGSKCSPDWANEARQNGSYHLFEQYKLQNSFARILDYYPTFIESCQNYKKKHESNSSTF